MKTIKRLIPFTTLRRIVLSSSCYISLLVVIMTISISCSSNDDLDPINNQDTDDNSPPSNTDSPDDNNPPSDYEYNIIYTDIKPDFIGQDMDDTYALDLNNDQLVDYNIFIEDWINSFELRIDSNPDIENSLIVVHPWVAHPVPLRKNNRIYNLEGYNNGEHYEISGLFAVGYCFGGELYCYQDWKDKGDRYLGLRFIINDQTHYGWARMNILSLSEWAIKDYAYNAIPDMPIRAGQME